MRLHHRYIIRKFAVANTSVILSVAQTAGSKPFYSELPYIVRIRGSKAKIPALTDGDTFSSASKSGGSARVRAWCPPNLSKTKPRTTDGGPSGTRS